MPRLNIKAVVCVTVVLLAGTQGSAGADDTRLPCKLEWVPSTSGNPVPETAVKCNGNGIEEFQQFVVRASRGMGQVGKVVGRLDPTNDYAYIPIESENGTATAVREFDVLTNPNKCITIWSFSEPGFVVPTETGSLRFVGRAQPDAYNWLSGEIASNRISVPIDDDNEIYIATRDIQYLLSYSGGFDLHLVDFLFEEELEGTSPDFMSIDEIHNESPSTVAQAITHTKVIREITKVKTTNIYISTETSSFGFDVIFYGKKKSETHTYTRTETAEVTTEVLTNVSTTTRVVVPPYTSVRVCSLIELKEEFTTDYTADGIYTAPGMSSNEVYERLRGQGLNVQRRADGHVFIQVRGTLTAAVAMAAKMMVVPYASNDKCILVQRELALRRNALHVD